MSLHRARRFDTRRLFTLRLALVCVALGVFVEPAKANPANKQALLRFLGKYRVEQLDSCAVCHVRAHPEGVESLDDFPHNEFGARLSEIGEEHSIRDRLMQIADEDSDGDGISNLRELLFGKFPGDSKVKPNALAAEKIEQRLIEFREYSKRYQWRPFDPVVRPAVPIVKSTSWSNNPIDQFIASEHEARDLRPQGPATPEALLRRVYLDLIGLSPSAMTTREFKIAFEKDSRAYENVVDQLLDDPAYGERWGRHWMDVWRYSDWAGYRKELRESQRHIWHWRDWIIESLNDDKPYDRMLVEMLAADEIVPEDAGALRATGYLARHFHRNRDQWMDDIVKHTSQAFLGITVGCAKCHDHMYDPISQREYYSMRAIFERYNVRTDRIPNVLDTAVNGIPRAYDNSLTANTWFLEAGDERRPIKDSPIPAGVPASLGGSFAVKVVSLPRLAAKPDRRDFVRADLLAKATKAITAAKDESAKKTAEYNVSVLKAQFEIEEIEDSGKKDSDDWIEKAKSLLALQRESAVFTATWKLKAAETAMAKATESLTKAEKGTDKSAQSKARKSLETAKKALTAAKKALSEAEKSAGEKLTTKFTPRKQATFPNKSNGRRSAFARWLTARENPLAARVAVNHIWLRHFGQGIVPRPNEFGGNGREPTHPALLDWLAAEFMDQGWSMKKLHKLIVMSQTYRMSSRFDESNTAIDPDNRLLWRMPIQRMEGELVRDNLLHVSGRLDRKMGGPEIDNNLAQSSTRRSIYLRHAHEKLVEFVQIFDGASVSECYMREKSIKPHQALALANSPLTVAGSKKLATTLRNKTENDPERFVDEAYLTILNRQPLPDESKLCLEFLGDVSNDQIDQNRFEALITVLFNHNDFVAIR